MTKTCTVCRHERVREIDDALIQRVPYRSIEADYGVGRMALARHRREHLPELLAKGREAERMAVAVRPMLAVSQGALIMLSTPAGRRGVFFEEWTEGMGWGRYEVPAAEVPRISGTFLEEERRSLPRRVYRQEYECSFEEAEGAVFLTEDIEKMISSDVKPLFPELEEVS